MRIKPLFFKQRGGGFKDLEKYLPNYLFQERVITTGIFSELICRTAEIFIKIFLKPGEYDDFSVDAVYDREAATYDGKHHLTTYGLDTNFRRLAGWTAVSLAHNVGVCIDILDLCTGTGLAISEIMEILKNFGIAFKITGVDYNEKMLKIAKRRLGDNSRVKLCRDDITQCRMGFEEFSFDFVSQIFGIGGIDEPYKVFQSVLEVLREGGQYLMADIHRPLPFTSKDTFLLYKWFKFPNFEQFAYERVTLPIVLKKLWGWNDPTKSFYLLPLVTYQDSDGIWWGFKKVFFNQESVRWWFGLPTMPIASIIVEKFKLLEKEAVRRQQILALIKN